jgi:hypothetical protein
MLEVSSINIAYSRQDLVGWGQILEASRNPGVSSNRAPYVSCNAPSDFHCGPPRIASQRILLGGIAAMINRCLLKIRRSEDHFDC